MAEDLQELESGGGPLAVLQSECLDIYISIPDVQ